MRIVYVCEYDLRNETGISRVAQDLAGEISKSNQVLYICLGKKFRKRKINDNLSILFIPSVKVKWNFFPLLSTGVIKKINKTLKDFAPDIVHSHTNFSLFLTALLWTVKHNIPHVITFHYVVSDGFLYDFPSISKQKTIKKVNFEITKAFLKKILDYTDLHITLNNSVYESLKAYDSKTPIKIIENCIDYESFAKAKIANFKKPLRFIFLGTYAPRKNQIFLIKAFSHLDQDYQLELYGKIATSKVYVNRLKALIKEGNITNVTIHGFLSRKQVVSTLEKSHFLVSASLKEAQSLVVIEAMASGTPIIGLENETTSQLVTKETGLLIKKNANPREFANKIKELIQYSSEPSYQKMALDSRKSARKFSLSSVANKTIHAYENTVSSFKSRDKKAGKLLQLLPESVRVIFEFESPELKRASFAVGISIISSVFIYIGRFIKEMFIVIGDLLFGEDMEKIYSSRYEFFSKISKIFIPLAKKHFSFSPNFVTSISIVSGLLATYFLFNNQKYFLLFLIIHVILDTLDGFLAKSLNKITKLGYYLDRGGDMLIATTLLLKTAVIGGIPLAWISVFIYYLDFFVTMKTRTLRYNFPSRVFIFFFIFGYYYEGLVVQTTYQLVIVVYKILKYVLITKNALHQKGRASLPRK